MSNYCSHSPGRDVRVRLEFGRQKLLLGDLSTLAVGRIIELDCRCDAPVDVVADGRCIARGQPVNVDGCLGVRIEDAAAYRSLQEKI